jgi:alpha-L-arabinofuranosidase
LRTADDEGFGQDVLELLNALHIPIWFCPSGEDWTLANMKILTAR